MTEIPTTVSRRPWSRASELSPIKDADGKVVSFIQEAQFLFHVEQCHEPLIGALKDAKRQLLCHGASRCDLRRINDALKMARGRL